MKYFNFLLENDITFKQDETGNYTALVKVFNPEYYQKKDKTNVNKEKNNFNSEALKTKSDPRHFRSNSASAKQNLISNEIPKINEKQGKKELTSNYNDVFSKRYLRFFKNLNPLIGIRGKKLNPFNLKYMIEEIYAIRFMRDTSTLKNQLNRYKEIDMKDPFPKFVLDFLFNKYNKKSIIDRNALDLLISVDYYRNYNKDVAIFAKFLDETYDLDDLIFFLFVRSCIEKEMKILFIEKAKEDIKLQFNENKFDENEIFLNNRVCLKIASTIFGSEEEIILNSFQEKIKKNMTTTKQGTYMIQASTVLSITLQDYHESRHHYNNESHYPSEINKNNEEYDKNSYFNPNLEENQDEEIRIIENGYNNRNQAFNSNKGAYEINKPRSLNYEENDNIFMKSNNRNKNNTNIFQDSLENPSQNNFDSFKQQNSNHRDELNNYNEGTNFQNTTLKVLITNFIKGKELDLFFDGLLKSYSINQNEDKRLDDIIFNVKYIISEKLDILINILFRDDKSAWCNALDIPYTQYDNLRHYDQLIKILRFMQNIRNINEIPHSLFQSFAQNFLLTHELNIQINKLIVTNLNAKSFR